MTDDYFKAFILSMIEMIKEAKRTGKWPKEGEGKIKIPKESIIK